MQDQVKKNLEKLTLKDKEEPSKDKSKKDKNKQEEFKESEQEAGQI